MIASTQTPSLQNPAGSSASAPEGWDKLRAAGDIQFAPVAVPDVPPREPNWFERMLQAVFEFIGDVLAPAGQWLGEWWGVIQWVLIALVGGFVIYWLVRSLGPMVRRRAAATSNDAEEWRPDKAASLALLEDADRLAAEGRFDEATHLLLTRSVGQIASARPEWVEPSSTARELAGLAALPHAPRAAFAVIAERVERSLFALERLDRADWEAARAAYAGFALAITQNLADQPLAPRSAR